MKYKIYSCYNPIHIMSCTFKYFKY